MELPPIAEGHARCVLMRIMSFCAEAAGQGRPLDAVEIINDAKGLLIGSEDVDWSELYKDLTRGFVYEGMLHGAETGREGVSWTAFLRDDDTSS